jgi:predicted MFS family arabinose efflux permease
MPRLNLGHTLRSLVPESRDQRVYLMAALVNVYGTGLIFTAMTLYALRVVHLSPVRSGLALTIAGLVGLLSAMPMGRLADRRGPRDVSRLALLLLGAAAASYVFFAHSFVSYLIVAIVDGSALSASTTASVPLAGAGGPQPGHIAGRGHLRHRHTAQHGDRVPGAVPG